MQPRVPDGCMQIRVYYVLPSHLLVRCKVDRCEKHRWLSVSQECAASGGIARPQEVLKVKVKEGIA